MELAVDPKNYQLEHHWDEAIGLRCVRCQTDVIIPESQWFYLGTGPLSLAHVLATAHRHEEEYHA